MTFFGCLKQIVKLSSNGHYNHSDILPSTSRRVVINLKVNTSIAIISIYIPVELKFDAALIESKGLFGKIKKWENCNFS